MEKKIEIDWLLIIMIILCGVILLLGLIEKDNKMITFGFVFPGILTVLKILSEKLKSYKENISNNSKGG